MTEAQLAALMAWVEAAILRETCKWGGGLDRERRCRAELLAAFRPPPVAEGPPSEVDAPS